MYLSAGMTLHIFCLKILTPTNGMQMALMTICINDNDDHDNHYDQYDNVHDENDDNDEGEG